MKNIIIIAFLTAIAISCNAQKINETAVTFLVDATEKPIFDAIEADFNQNLNYFFNNTSTGNIDFGQRLTIRMGVIEESDNFTLQSRSIALTDRRVSRQQAERLRNPRPLLELIRDELARYKELSNTTMTSSPIIDVTLKAFREMNTEAREILVICTDGLEYSNYGNFYRNIPTTEQSVEQFIGELDVLLLAEVKDKVDFTDPEVIIVLKANSKARESTTQLKLFYNEFLRQLGVGTVRFIDNLSNNPNL